MSNIHPTAVIEDGAAIAESASVGPYCIIGPDVSLAEDVELKSHVVIDGVTSIGVRSCIYPFASLGQRPQDLKYQGEKSRLEIGADTTVREHVTIHTGTEGGGMLTKVGDNCLIMGSVHIAHDCVIGNNVILSQGAAMGGHVQIDDFAILGGAVALHHFVRIGAHAMIGGASAVDHDVIPYGSVNGERASLSGINLIGMRRGGSSKDETRAMLDAFKAIFAGEGTLAERVDQVAKDFAGTAPVMEVVEFLRADTSRPICKPPSED